VKGDHNGMRAFVISLQRLYFAAKSKGQAATFGANETYVELMKVKMPHLIPKWTKKFEDDQGEGEVSFPTFKKFVLRTSKLDKKILGNLPPTVINQRSVSFGPMAPKSEFTIRLFLNIQIHQQTGAIINLDQGLAFQFAVFVYVFCVQKSTNWRIVSNLRQNL
jgi:hypothetical protein